ncbi:MAG: GNAT superfamily N-acetyltransferase [Cyclobacteriaceae bacterium]|jgi:GNAT superfamily N-acetyltransferase
MKIREAVIADLPCIVKMLSNDELGKLRELYEDPLPQSYYNAFGKIDADPNQLLVVVAHENKEIIGTLQLTIIPYLNYQGSSRALIESVRVRDDFTGKGIGANLIQWAIDKAKNEGAYIVQLNSDKQRPDAIRFYEKLGFKATHEGFKLHFD